MTKKQKSEFYRKCAIFLGWKYSQTYSFTANNSPFEEIYHDGLWYNPSNKYGWYTPYKINGLNLTESELNFNEIIKFMPDPSWDWIMDIISKINQLPHSDLTNEIVSLRMNTSKTKTILAINKFLDSYNK